LNENENPLVNGERGSEKGCCDCVPIRIINTIIIIFSVSAFVGGLLITFYQEAVRNETKVVNATSPPRPNLIQQLEGLGDKDERERLKERADVGLDLPLHKRLDNEEVRKKIMSEAVKEIIVSTT